MKNSSETRELLIKHYKTYPRLQIQDIFKFLYQSAFGCEHLVSSPEAVTEFIGREYKTVHHKIQSAIEQLDGGYCRVHLSCLDDGMSVNTLGKLFFLSAKKEADGEAALIEKLRIAGELVSEKLLPFGKNAFEKAAREWKLNGFPAIHHSEAFREAYKPSYRVIANEFIPFLPFFTQLDKRLVKGQVKVAIEGGSGSGKTTLGRMLSDIYDCTVFHMDDFFLRPEQRTPGRYAEPGGNVDRERFLSEVLLPLGKDEPFSYRKFDCSSMSLGESVTVVPEKLIVTEGAYSMHPDLAPHYDFSVFLDISPELQKKRIIQRNTPSSVERFFYEWIPLEREYFSAMNIKEKCDMVISVR